MAHSKSRYVFNLIGNLIFFFLFLYRRKKEWQSCGINLRNVRPCVLAGAHPSRIRTRTTASRPLMRNPPATPPQRTNNPCLHPSPILPTSTRARANWVGTTATTAVCPCCTNESRTVESQEGNVKLYLETGNLCTLFWNWWVFNSAFRFLTFLNLTSLFTFDNSLSQL